MIVFVVALFISTLSFIDAFGETSNEIASFSLHISKDMEDLEIMKSSCLDNYAVLYDNPNSFVKDEVLNNDNELSVHIIEKYEVEECKYISGYGTIRIDGNLTDFFFSNSQLNTGVLSNGEEYCYSCIEIFDYNNLPILIDFIASDNFSKVTATTSCGLVENGVGVLFWGSIFKGYNDICMSQLSSKSSMEENLDIPTKEVASYGNFDYVGKVKSASVSGGSGSGETVIVVVGKRDFRDGNATNGFEMIRVFSRTSNAKTYIANATSAHVVEIDMDFKCTSNGFLTISSVVPKASATNMPRIFSLLESLHPVAGALIAAVNLVGYSDATSVFTTIEATSGFTQPNHALIKVNTATTNNADINLPSGTSYSNAQTDTSHGFSGEIQYQKYLNLNSGNVTSKARIKYRFYYSNHRYTSAYTNYAAYTHTIYQ